MLVFPLVLTVIGYVICLKKYKTDREMYDNINGELAAKGDLK